MIRVTFCQSSLCILLISRGVTRKVRTVALFAVMNDTQTTLFNTGHHTTKMFVPSHHLSRGGFEFDFATGAGKPIALEEWTIAEAWRYEDVIKAMRDSVMV